MTGRDRLRSRPVNRFAPPVAQHAAAEQHNTGARESALAHVLGVTGGAAAAVKLVQYASSFQARTVKIFQGDAGRTGNIEVDRGLAQG